MLSRVTDSITFSFVTIIKVLVYKGKIFFTDFKLLFLLHLKQYLEPSGLLKNLYRMNE